MEPASFGRIVRERRNALDLTQEELARLVGCARVTIRKIEYGELRPSVQIAGRLADKLAVSDDERTAFVRLARRSARLATPPPPTLADATTSECSSHVLKGYELRERLGAGGFGVVYRAYHPGVGRDVALKIILPQYANHPDFIRSFEAEAQIVARLEHPHIVPLYDFWREPSGATLVLRYIRGGSLQTTLNAGRLPLDRVVGVLDQIAVALMVAHRAGVIHRNFKPSNVLLDDDGNAYLTDFGIASDLLISAPLDAELSRSRVGALAYLAPEQLRAEPVTVRTDIYSLGVMLYEVLTGVMLRQHLNEPVPSVQVLRPDLPIALDAVIQRATATSPSDRYADAQQFVVDLRHALASSTMRGNDTGAGLSRHAHLRLGTAPTVLTAVIDAPVLPLESPYKGLRAFGEPDAANFFGRAALIERLVERLAADESGSRFLAVVGPSGSGKSSVVNAGLIPALRRGAVPGSDRWFIVDMQPGPHPLEALEAALLRVAVNPPTSLLEYLAADERGLLRAVNRVLPVDAETELVLVIDQFEELFTLVENAAVRVHLLDSLRIASTDPTSRMRLIVTLRADFYDRPLRYQAFGDLMRDRTEVVLPLASDELREAIIGPAEQVGVLLEPELVAALAHDVDAQPGALPLLQYALMELFERRDGRTLSLVAYHAIGGVQHALVRRAEEVYTALSTTEQETAQQIFLRLITLGEGTEDTRRRVLLSELESLIPAAQQESASIPQVLPAFDRARLLTFDRDPRTRGATVEVAHEAVLHEWARLRGWLEQSRADVRTERVLASAVAEWIAADRDASYLLSGARLQHFEGWAAHTRVALTTDERAFLASSLAERAHRQGAERDRQQRELLTVQHLATMEQRRADEQRRAAVRLRRRALVLTVALGLAVIAAVVAGVFATTSAANFALAESQRLAAEANGVLQRGESAELAALLAIRGLHASYTPQADAALQRSARSYYGARMWTQPGPVQDLVVSPDGAQMLTGSQDGTVRLWDMGTGQQVRAFTGHTEWINAVALSPDGTHVLTSSEDRTTRLWDRGSGQEVQQVSLPNTIVMSVAFSPDSRSFVIGGADGTVQVWNRETGVQQHAFTFPANIRAVTFSPDGRYVVAGGGTGMAQLWDAATGQPLRTFSGHRNDVMDMAFTPDGRSMVTAALDTTARLWDVATGDLVRTFTGHEEALFQAAISPDWKYLLTGSLDLTARLWDIATGTEVRRFIAHTGSVYTVAFSPDGRAVLTGSKDGTVRLWDLNAPIELNTLGGQTAEVFGLAFSPDGKYLLTGSVDTTAILWDTGMGTQLRVLPHAHRVDAAAFSPDGMLVLTNGIDGSARLWDVASGNEVRSFANSGGNMAAFTPDGRSIFTGGPEPHAVQVWDVATGASVRTFVGHTGGGVAAALSRDGRYVVTASDSTVEGNVRLWDATTGTSLHIVQNPSPVVGVALSPDGRYALTGSRDNIARLWDVATGQVVREFVGHTNIIWNVAFSLDGTYVVTASLDKTARLWDVATGQQLRVFPGHANAAVGSAIVSPDERTVAIGSFDGVTQLTDVDVHILVQSVCARVLRDFTADERAVYSVKDATPTCVNP